MPKYNFEPEPEVGRFYWCKLSNAKTGSLFSVYLCWFDVVSFDSYEVIYQPCYDDKKPMHNSVKTTWKKSEVTLDSFEEANINGFFAI